MVSAHDLWRSRCATPMESRAGGEPGIFACDSAVDWLAPQLAKLHAAREGRHACGATGVWGGGARGGDGCDQRCAAVAVLRRA